jgi:hypothetical protein
MVNRAGNRKPRLWIIYDGQTIQIEAVAPSPDEFCRMCVWLVAAGARVAKGA